MDRALTLQHRHNIENVSVDSWNLAKIEINGFISTDNDGTFNKTHLLKEMLGFTRHERLDVKKPGPPADIPIEDHPAINSSAVKDHINDVNNDGLLPKIKKVLHSDTDDDHAPHSVDTQYAHVILKTP